MTQKADMEPRQDKHFLGKREMDKPHDPRSISSSFIYQVMILWGFHPSLLKEIQKWQGHSPEEHRP